MRGTLAAAQFRHAISAPEKHFSIAAMVTPAALVFFRVDAAVSGAQNLAQFSPSYRDAAASDRTKDQPRRSPSAVQQSKE
jgi:hypothetical protein